MLTIKRRVGEKLIVVISPDEQIEITLYQMNGPSKATIGITAPRNYQIHKGELVDQFDEYGQRKESNGEPRDATETA